MGYLLRGLALLLLVVSGQAVYEEQAGQYGWHKGNIGGVTHVEFAFRGRERVFVATAENVVASLDTRDGSVAWRQVLEEGDSIDSLLLVPRPASVLTISRQGRIVRAWHALDGSLLWERVIGDRASEGKALALVLPDVTGDGSSEVVVASGPKLQVLSAPDGKLVWSASLSGEILAITQGGDAQQPCIVVATSVAGDLHVAKYIATDGAEQMSKQLIPGAEQVDLSADYIAAITSDGKLCSGPVGGSLKCQPLTSILPGLEEAVQLGGILATSTVALHAAGLTVLADIGGSGREPSSLLGITAAGRSSPEHSSLVGLAGVSDKGLLQTSLLDVSSGKIVEQHSIPANLLTSSGKALKVTKVVLGSRRVGEYKQPEATLYRFLVTTEDDSLHLVEGGKTIWRRDEGLGSIESTLFVDLPAGTAELDAELKAARPTLMDRINAEILTIKGSFGIIKPEEQATLQEINSRISTHLLPHRDTNGFRKLILALSKSGTLYALHSGNGRLIWRMTMDREVPPKRLFLWRSSHDTQHAPEVLVIGSAGQETVYSVVNAHSGKLVTSGSMAGKLEKVIELSTTLTDGTAEQHVFALASSGPAPSIQLLPRSTLAEDLIKEQPLYFWRFYDSTGLLVGYKADSCSRPAEELWAVAFNGPSNNVLHIAARDPQEHIYSYAKILGDRSLKLKFLNPNAIFVVSGPPDGVFTSSLGGVSLTVQLIDTISGQVLYRQTLEGARSPATAALSENWAVYSYYSTINQRFEMAVLEFYDVQSRSLSIPSLLFGNQSSTLSSFAPTPIEVLHQSYFTGIGLKAMAVTATRRGITSKQLLLGTASNQVYLMDKRFVDPRRPKGTPTADEKAEMLPPYTEELPFVPTLYASHNKIVEGLRGIVTSPANLESTTLTLSYGLDLFFARVQPSKSFDLLPDDFPYAMLILVTVALLVGALVLKRMEDSSAVKRKWT